MKIFYEAKVLWAKVYMLYRNWPILGFLKINRKILLGMIKRYFSNRII